VQATTALFSGFPKEYCQICGTRTVFNSFSVKMFQTTCSLAVTRLKVCNSPNQGKKFRCNVLTAEQRISTREHDMHNVRLQHATERRQECVCPDPVKCFWRQSAVTVEMTVYFRDKTGQISIYRHWSTVADFRQQRASGPAVNRERERCSVKGTASSPEPMLRSADATLAVPRTHIKGVNEASLAAGRFHDNSE
jgi:hypothetical protein